VIVVDGWKIAVARKTELHTKLADHGDAVSETIRLLPLQARGGGLGSTWQSTNFSTLQRILIHEHTALKTQIFWPDSARAILWLWCLNVSLLAEDAYCMPDVWQLNAATLVPICSSTAVSGFTECIILMRVWDSEVVPADWCKGIILPLCKSKNDRIDQSQCGTFRGIGLLTVPGKFCAHFLLSNMRPSLLHSSTTICDSFSATIRNRFT
jgi:hypothetical protein